MDLSLSIGKPTNFFCRVSSHLQRRCRCSQLRNISINNHNPQSHGEERDLFSKPSRRSGGSRRRRNSLREKLLLAPKRDQVRQVPIELHENDSLSSNSLLFDRFEQDSEFWGNGSKPISPIVEEFKDFGSEDKFLVEGKRSSFIGNLQTVLIIRDFPWTNGLKVLFIFYVFGVAVKKLFFAGNSKKVEPNREELEMLRRKKKSRMEKNMLEKGRIEVVPDVQPLRMESYTRPQLDRNELLKSIKNAEESRESLVKSDSLHHFEDRDFENKVREIREMAREARELEQKDRAQNDKIGEINELSSIVANREVREIAQEVHELERKDGGQNSKIVEVEASELSSIVADKEIREMPREIKEMEQTNPAQNNKIVEVNELSSVVADREIREMKLSFQGLEPNDLAQNNKIGEINERKDSVNGNSDDDTKSSGFSKEIPTPVANISQHTLRNEDVKQNEIESIDSLEKESGRTLKSVRKIPKIIKSVKEAKEFLSQKHGMPTAKLQSNDVSETNFDGDSMSSMRINDNKVFGENKPDLPNNISIGILEKTSNIAHTSGLDESFLGDENSEITCFRTENLNADQISAEDQSECNNLYTSDSGQALNNIPDEGHFDSKAQAKTFQDGFGVNNVTNSLSVESKNECTSGTSSVISSLEDSTLKKGNTEKLDINGHQSWAAENFQKFDPIINTIGSGFRENYMLAKEKEEESSIVSSEVSELARLGEDEELEWMKDEKLREIVFQVRDNELAGRDPFHLMDADDQLAFFKGLELKAEKVNEKLLGLHEWVHSRIENLDYGRDGISLDDPLEKIVPHWKGSTFDKEVKFLDKKSTDSNSVSPLIIDKTPNKDKASTSGNTLIECSDGSMRPGKKKGKEHWQHTKKWSQGFLEVYNAETDPEVKSIMKDMGKGLDRWITEKETKEVADLMTRIPKRQRRYIQKKMDKLKREINAYGPQAVVSKYREYSDEKGEDYLWWLDIQFVLCIELYTVEDGVQKVGFYSLEMAADLELDPRQYHVIAFEDPGDAKNFCYIVQAHMETVGSGAAFVVARPPKDAFREAKANGFNVTVIRKGEMKLNIDKTLDEVEEEMVEIGSKVYHDAIMSERAVDIRTLLKGVISADKATKRKPKGMLMNTSKS